MTETMVITICFAVVLLGIFGLAGYLLGKVLDNESEKK